MTTTIPFIIPGNLKGYKIILGSNSPRRKMLMEGAGLTFEVRILEGIDETYPETVKKPDVALYLAQKKMGAYLTTLEEDELLITADTIVYVGGEILGKPSGREEAIAMLETLRGRTHEVITGVCIATKRKWVSFSVTTNVNLSSMSDEDIIYYVDNYHPYDKAGAYGIQEWIGYVAAEGIEGSFYNVMGLPIERVYKELSLF
ncbi:MAG: Maf family nucleotide pyrophosphatase [Tannerellaceae bacterium]|jgi:septum formation protein|nr:Maf family nucleotide pyrophosphatase [Tannerellaceae bacterium]